MRSKGVRLTIGGIMLAMIPVACSLGFWSYLQRWEARRVVMYRQRDVTRAVMEAARRDIAAASPGAVSRRTGDRVTYTRRWTERLDAWEVRGGREVPLIRATVSGANGRFSLPPIAVLVETTGSPSEARWLERLTRAYRARGWRHEISRVPVGERRDRGAE